MICINCDKNRKRATTKGQVQEIPGKMKYQKIAAALLILIALVFTVNAERLPVFQEQPYYSILTGWLNVSFTENGTFKAGINSSMYDLNVTNKLIINNTLTVLGSVGVSGSLNASSINTTGGAYFATSSGNVGINTTVPANTLTVQGTLNVTPAGQGSTPSVFVTSGRNVGIGTASPGRTLTVIGDANISGNIDLYDGGASRNLTFLWNPATGNELVGITFARDASANVFAKIIAPFYTGGGGLAFFTGDTGASAERIRIDNTGNVGIGTTTPASLLHLSSTTSEIRLNDTDNPNWWQVGAVGDDFRIALNDSTTDVLYIDQDGNVGIGTSNPLAKLDVAGNLAVRGSGGYDLRLYAGDDSNWRVGYVNGVSAFTTSLVTGGAIFSAAGKNAGEGFAFGGSPSGLSVLELNNADQRAYFRGNVGIGTTSPNYLLQVASGTDGRSVNLSNVLYVNGSSQALTPERNATGSIGTNTLKWASGYIINLTTGDLIFESGIRIKEIPQGICFYNSSDEMIACISNNGLNLSVGHNFTGSTSWNTLYGIPAGFADNVDDTGAGSDVTNNSFTNATGLAVGSFGINSSGDINSTTNFYIGSNAVLTAVSSFFDSFYKLLNFTSNYGTEYAATGFKIINLTAHPLFKNENSTTRFGIDYANQGFDNENASARFGVDYANIGFKLANLSRIGNIDINSSGSLNISGNITFTQLKSCDTINTDNTGLLTCGNDATGGGTIYNIENFTSNYDARSDRYGNANFTTQYNNIADRFLNINFTTLYNNILDRFGNFNWTTLYNNEALTRYSDANASDVAVGGETTGTIGSITLSNTALDDQYIRLGDINNLNLTRLGKIDINTSGSLNVSGNITFTQLKSCDTINTDSTGLLTCGSDASGGGDTSAFNLGNYSLEYASTGYKLVNFTFNFADRLTELWKLSNFTTAYDNRVDRFLNFNWTTLYNNEAGSRWSISNDTAGLLAINTSLFTKLGNNTMARFAEINITGQAGFNATIWLGNGSIQYNGSHICLGAC